MAAQLNKEASPPWPEDASGKQILNTYLDSMHRRVPFFNFEEVLQLHQKRELSLTTDHKTRFLAFKLFMVYAIGSMILKLTKVNFDRQPEDYLEFANRFNASLTDLSPVERIEIALFNVVYRLRVSLDSKTWIEIGLAMRIAVEAGLHREEYYKDLHPSVKEWTKRLFWGVYVMERNISFSLKRPVSIAEHDIDAGLPALQQQTLSWTSQPDLSGQGEENPSRLLDLNTFAAIVSLLRIKSDLHTMISRVDRDASTTLAQVPAVLNRLREFDQTLPNYIGSDHDFLQLHTNNAVRTLIEPFLTFLSPDDELVTVCAQAAGRVCQLFKKLRLRKALGYSFPMVNSVFVAGMTICYVLFKNPSLWTPALANDLRACSSILFVIAERNQRLRKYCDVLEAIINSVMEHIEHAGSPYPSSTTNDIHAEQESERSPIEFHTLKDTFKAFKFELPLSVYPSYTTDPKASQTNDSGPSPDYAMGRTGASDGFTSGLGVEEAENYAARASMSFSDDLLSFDQGALSLDSIQGSSIGDSAAGYYIHESYTQQMMEELLAQNQFK